MGQFGALRRAGGPRRVQDHRGVVGIAVDDLAPGLDARQHLLELAGLDHDALGAGLLRAGVRVVGEALPGEQQLRPGIAEIEGDLAALEEHVHRHHNAAGAQHPVVADGEVVERWEA